MTAWLRLSAVDAAGHDTGRIHLVRADNGLTLCGAIMGRNGTVPHDIGPTCKRCKATATRERIAY